MNNKEIADALIELSKLYTDSAWNYDRAMQIIKDEKLKTDLAEMQTEHLEQVDLFKNYAKQLGETNVYTDIPGVNATGITVIEDDMTEEDIVLALRRNEEMISKKLEQLAEDVMIPEIVHDLEEDLDDENEYIKTLNKFPVKGEW
jgi:hypothetical protein